MVHVRLYSTLRKYGNRNREEAPLSIPYITGLTIKILLAELGIRDEGQVSMIVVNGRLKGQEYDYSLRDGDDVGLYGYFAGG
jgi:molybdopterin converting factor small subunit